MAKKKMKRKIEQEGIVHIHSSFNNTVVTITDKNGNTIAAASAGSVGYKGTKKSTPFAASMATEKAVKDAMAFGLKSAEIWIKGPGAGRDAAIRSVQATGLKVTLIKDVTPIPHNGCRPKKQRRV